MTTTFPAQVVPLLPTAGPEPADLTETLQRHEAFRALLAQVEKVVARTPACDRHTYAVLVRRWWTFRKAWARHQGSGIWSLLDQRVPGHHGDERLTLDAMQIEHEMIDLLLGQCLSWGERLAAGSDEQVRATLLSRTSSLRMLLDHHFAHEQAEALPLVQRHLTRAEWARLQNEGGGVGAAADGHRAAILPWVAVTP